MESCWILTPRLVQAFCFGLLTYFILSHVIRYWANHVASNVKDSLACLNDPAPPAPWALSWIFACCQPKSSGHDPGSCDGDNLKSAWKGLEESQQRYLRSVMHKARSLQVAGIAEQRVSGMWKMIEMGAAALTPIFISIEGMFGSKFSQPLKVVAILLSLVTTVCQVAPKNQATSILDYHARLRKLVFAYWSLTTIFNVYEENENQRPSMDTPAFEAQRASVFSSFVMALSKEVQDAENELKDVFTTTRLTKDQVPVPLYGPPNQGSSGDGTNAPASTTPAGADATDPRPAEARQGNWNEDAWMQKKGPPTWTWIKNILKQSLTGTLGALNHAYTSQASKMGTCFWGSQSGPICSSILVGKNCNDPRESFHGFVLDMVSDS